MAPSIGEELFDLKDSIEKVAVRVFAPEQEHDGVWRCSFEVGAPIGRGLDVHGESSLQALALAMFALSAMLYGSEEHREGRLGVRGTFGESLGFPAPTAHHFIEPGEKRDNG